MAIRFVDRRAIVGRIAATLDGVQALVEGTHVRPSGRTGVVGSQLAPLTMAAQGGFTQSANRSGPIVSTLGGVTATIFGTSSGAALALGAHGKDYDLDQLGSSPSSVTLNTQVSGSTMLVFRGCEFAAVNAPTDNKGNGNYSQVGGNQGYAGGLWPGFGIQIWAKAPAAGGTSHTVSFTKTAGNAADESSLVVAECMGAASIHASGFVARAASGAGASHASASITTTVPCRLFSVWSGDGVTGTPNFAANPSAGWSLIEFDWRPTGTAYIQMGVAMRDAVAPPGTYSLNWVPVSNQGSAIGIVAVAANDPATSATLSWTPPTQFNDGSPANIAGYNLYIGTSDANLTPVVQVPASTTSYTFTNLSPGTYYFAVKAFDSNGVEGDMSEFLTKVIA